MSVLEILAVAVAGFLAGISNALAGAGSLITFPTLIAVGVPQLAANVTSTVGLIPGALGAAIGYSEEVTSQRAADHPAERAVAARRLGRHRAAPAHTQRHLRVDRPGAGLRLLPAAALPTAADQHGSATPATSARPSCSPGWRCAGAYAAYFGSAVGILLIAILGLFILDSMQRLNAVKVVIAGLMNLLAAVVYAFLAPVHWGPALILMVSSMIGGQSGAWIAKRIDGDTLRLVIAIGGLLVAIVLGINAYG